MERTSYITWLTGFRTIDQSMKMTNMAFSVAKSLISAIETTGNMEGKGIAHTPMSTLRSGDWKEPVTLHGWLDMVPWTTLWICQMFLILCRKVHCGQLVKIGNMEAKGFVLSRSLLCVDEYGKNQLHHMVDWISYHWSRSENDQYRTFAAEMSHVGKRSNWQYARQRYRTCPVSYLRSGV